MAPICRSVAVVSSKLISHRKWPERDHSCLVRWWRGIGRLSGNCLILLKCETWLVVWATMSPTSRSILKNKLVIQDFWCIHVFEARIQI